MCGTYHIKLMSEIKVASLTIRGELYVPAKSNQLHSEITDGAVTINYGNEIPLSLWI